MDEPKSIVDQVIKENILRKRVEINNEKKKLDTVLNEWGWDVENGETMVVIKAGASGHNIRTGTSLKAPPNGMLALGDTLTVEEYVRIQNNIIFFPLFSLFLFTIHLFIYINGRWLMAMARGLVLIMIRQKNIVSMIKKLGHWLLTNMVQLI